MALRYFKTQMVMDGKVSDGIFIENQITPLSCHSKFFHKIICGANIPGMPHIKGIKHCAFTLSHLFDRLENNINTFPYHLKFININITWEFAWVDVFEPDSPLYMPAEFQSGIYNTLVLAQAADMLLLFASEDESLCYLLPVWYQELIAFVMPYWRTFAETEYFKYKFKTLSLEQFIQNRYLHISKKEPCKIFSDEKDIVLSRYFKPKDDMLLKCNLEEIRKKPYYGQLYYNYEGKSKVLANVVFRKRPHNIDERKLWEHATSANNSNNNAMTCDATSIAGQINEKQNIADHELVTQAAADIRRDSLVFSPGAMPGPIGDALRALDPDARQIINLRLQLDEKGKLLTWRRIAELFRREGKGHKKYTGERCRQIYEKAVKQHPDIEQYVLALSKRHKLNYSKRPKTDEQADKEEIENIFSNQKFDLADLGDAEGNHNAGYRVTKYPRKPI